MTLKSGIIILFVLLAVLQLQAQVKVKPSKSKPQTHKKRPILHMDFPPDVPDTKSISVPQDPQQDKVTAQTDSIHKVIRQLLATITGPIGHKRDWEVVKQIFLPEAQLVINTPKNVKVMPASMLWVKGDSLYGKVSFRESETSFKVKISGTIATVEQGYFCTVNEKPSHYGTNVYTLVERPNRNWLITHLAWYQVPARQP